MFTEIVNKNIFKQIWRKSFEVTQWLDIIFGRYGNKKSKGQWLSGKAAEQSYANTS